jgi:hypothetical protein
MNPTPTSTIDAADSNVWRSDEFKEVSPIEKTGDASWRITLAEDPLTGELILPLPQELLDAQGWCEGDTMVWDYDEISGQAVLKKQE